MEALARALGDHPFFRDITPYDLMKLASCAHEVAFPAGAVICREGKPATAFYLIQRGKVALEINAPPRGAVRVETLGAGDVLGLSWLYPPHRWHADGHVVEPVDAVAINAACLLGKLDEDPALGYAVSRSLVKQLYERLERVRLQRLDVYRSEP